MRVSVVAQGIINGALAEAGPLGGRQIRTIGVRVNRYSEISIDSLLSNLKAAARGTAAERADFDVNLMDLIYKCGGCGKIFLEPENGKPACPDCGGVDLDIEVGPSVRIFSLTVTGD